MMPDLPTTPPRKPAKTSRVSTNQPAYNSTNGTRFLGGAILVLAIILAWFFWYIPQQSQDPGQLLEASYQNLMPDSVLAGPKRPTNAQLEQTGQPTKKPITPKTQKPAKPATLAKPEPAKPVQTELATSSKAHIHTVLAGQTLFQICRKYGLTEAQIRQANNLSGPGVQVGQILQIPVTGLHIVQAKETLSSIARKYNTSVAAIKQLNGLKNENLQLGQQLTIP